MSGKVLAWVVAVAAFALPAAFAAADPAERLKAVEQKIEEAEKEAKSVADQAQGMLGEMDKLDRSISSRGRKLRGLAAEIRAAEVRQNDARLRVEALDAELPRLRMRFGARVRGLYRLSRRGMAPVVFQAPRDWSEASRYQRSLEAVLAHDHAIVEELRRNRSDGEAAREQARLEASVLAGRRIDSEHELESLRAEREEKQAMLASLRGESEKRAKLLEELKASAEKLRDLIEKEEASKAAPFQAPPGAQGARMVPPLRSDPQQIATARNGVEIRARAGTPIQAVKTGRVVFAGWFTGYGKMVILDHGDHLYSVYGYATELLVEPGRVVQAGEAVATVGATGPVSLPSLYFEIRDHGVPRDPAAYISSLARK